MSYICKVLGIFNQKGGVGKTTVAALCAEYFALVKGLNVLVVDVDMQANSSDYWVGMEKSETAHGGQLPPAHPDYDGGTDYNERSTVADIFFGQTVLPYETYLKRSDEAGGTQGSVEILLAHPQLLERINTEFSNSSGDIERNVTNRLKEFLHHGSVKDAYDLVIIDTGPSRNPIFRAALRAATHAIIPFEPEEKSLQGINAMLQACLAENYARSGDDPQLKIIGLLPNKIRMNTNLHRTILGELAEGESSRMFPQGVYLPHSTAFPERDVKGIEPKSIFQLPASSKPRQYSEAVAAYVYERLFESGEQTELNINSAMRG